MKSTKEEILNELYNLILTKGTREWERTQLVATKNALENGAHLEDQLTIIEAILRPLATRNNLTPDVADFYFKIKNNDRSEPVFDFSNHLLTDLKNQEKAVFAGGCFWCMVEPFELKAGIVSVLSGYTGGNENFPTYDQVSGGYTNHVEAVEIIFDTRIISYQELLSLYWQITDPTDAFGQFQDRGSQYRPIIFVANQRQRQEAQHSKQKLIESGRYQKPIIIEIKPAETFWPAENYHQQFYKKQKQRYKRIKRARRQLLAYQQLQRIVHFGLSKQPRK